MYAGDVRAWWSIASVLRESSGGPFASGLIGGDQFRALATLRRNCLFWAWRLQLTEAIAPGGFSPVIAPEIFFFMRSTRRDLPTRELPHVTGTACVWRMPILRRRRVARHLITSRSLLKLLTAANILSVNWSCSNLVQFSHLGVSRGMRILDF